MAIVDLGTQYLELGNDWKQFVPTPVVAGDILPLRLSLISPSPEDLISRAIVRYSVEVNPPGGTVYGVGSGFDVYYSPNSQLFRIEMPSYMDGIGLCTVEARRFYRFRGVNPGSPMSLGIQYESDEVRNVNVVEDTFRVFTHGAIAAGTVGTLDFSGVTGFWRIYAVWVSTSAPAASDSIEITINLGASIVSYWNLGMDEVPWIVPPNLVSAANSIFLRPTSDLASVTLYAKRAELDGVVAV